MSCPSRKRRFPNADVADGVLSRIWRSRWRGPGKMPCRHYECDLCGGWHLTSMPKTAYEEQLSWEARND